MFLFVKRYLFAPKSHSVVNIITTLSLVSLSLPVAAVIILLSVFNGFGELLLQSNRVVDADITIVRAKGSLFEIEEIDREGLLALDGVASLSFVSEQTVLLERDGQQAVATLRGVDSTFLDVVPLYESIVRGEYRVELGELDRMVLGGALAYRLGALNTIDSYIDIYALRGSGFSSLLPMSNYTKRRMKLSGLFSADLQSEERYAVSSLRSVQQLTSSEGRATQISISLSEGSSEQRTIEQIEQLLGDEFVVKSRYELNPMLYDIVDYEKWGVLFISVLIMLLASFSLIGALSMLIIEKQRDMVTLRAMGAPWTLIRGIFFGEGLFISAIGVALGTLVGCTLTLLQEHFGFVKIPAQSFMSDHYPVSLEFIDVALVVVIAMAVASLLSYLVVGQMIKNNAK